MQHLVIRRVYKPDPQRQLLALQRLLGLPMDGDGKLGIVYRPSPEQAPPVNENAEDSGRPGTANAT